MKLGQAPNGKISFRSRDVHSFRGFSIFNILNNLTKNVSYFEMQEDVNFQKNFFFQNMSANKKVLPLTVYSTLVTNFQGLLA
jgi:hypothetical protein